MMRFLLFATVLILSKDHLVDAIMDGQAQDGFWEEKSMKANVSSSILYRLHGYQDALCLDGRPGGYYFRPGVAAKKHHPQCTTEHRIMLLQPHSIVTVTTYVTSHSNLDAFIRHPGYGNGSSKWYIHHEGGGWCQLETPYQTWPNDNCRDRSESRMGSLEA